MSGQNAVFFGRDSTILEHINPESGHCRLAKGAVEAICQLNRLGIKVVIVTNQPGIAKGTITDADMGLLHADVAHQLEAVGGHVDAFYCCPHDPDGSDAACACRKPKPGLLLRAAEDFKLNLSESFMISSKAIDVETGQAVDALAVLVAEAGTENETSCHPDHIADSLETAVEWVLRQRMEERLNEQNTQASG